MRRLLPILLAIIGLGAGGGAGLALRPDPVVEAVDETCPCDCAAEGSGLMSSAIAAEAVAADGAGNTDFVKLSNQFVIPVVKADRIAALVVLSISLEVAAGGSEPVYQREPKLRDAFLQVLFDHANSGGFDGAFTEGNKLDVLRMGLLETAVQELGNNVRNVLITDIARQDV